MKSFHHLLNLLEISPQKAVLATIIHVEGSAYRKEGAVMLFLDDGTQYGLLSAGCLEADLAARVPDIMEEGVSQVLNYDLRAEDDLYWGQGAGCNGVIQVLLEPVEEHLRDDLIQLKRVLDQGIAAVLLKKISSQSVIKEYLFLTEDGQTIGTWHGALPGVIRDRLFQESFGSMHAGTKPLSEIFESDTFASDRLYVQPVLPTPRVILIGAGPDAVPLAAFATQTGFSVTVVDWRQTACSPICFPQAETLVGRDPLLLLEKIKLTKRDSVILMTHHFQYDKEWLHLLIQQELHYLGVLGPCERTSRLLNGIEIPSWLHAPVGLSIGADGPEEIAISILAELVHHRVKVSR